MTEEEMRGSALDLNDLGERNEYTIPALPGYISPHGSEYFNVNSGLNLNTFGFADNFDESYDFVMPFFIDKNVTRIIEIGLTLQFSKFRGYTVSGTHTHDVVLPNHTHSVTIGDHDHTVSNHTHTVSNHTHTVSFNVSGETAPSGYALFINSVHIPTAFQAQVFNGGDVVSNLLGTTSSSGGGQTTSSGGGQTTSAGGGTTVSSAAGGGTTVTSGTAANAIYGIFEDSYPANITISVDGVDVTAELGGPWNPTDSTNDLVENLDITPFVTEGGLHRIEIGTSQRGRCLPLLWVKSIIGRNSRIAT